MAQYSKIQVLQADQLIKMKCIDVINETLGWFTFMFIVVCTVSGIVDYVVTASLPLRVILQWVYILYWVYFLYCSYMANGVEIGGFFTVLWCALNGWCIIFLYEEIYEKDVGLTSSCFQLITGVIFYMCYCMCDTLKKFYDKVKED